MVKIILKRNMITYLYMELKCN